jgi:hypothetical protein
VAQAALLVTARAMWAAGAFFCHCLLRPQILEPLVVVVVRVAQMVPDREAMAARVDSPVVAVAGGVLVPQQGVVAARAATVLFAYG